MAVWRPATAPPGSGRRPCARTASRPRSHAAARPALPPVAATPGWQRRLGLLAACTAPAVLLRIGGAHVPPMLAVLVFGGAVMAAAFILAAAAEAAEVDLSPGLATAGVAFVAVLPEFIIEAYFALTGQVEFVTASLTGSTRLLLSCAVGMPALASLVLVRRGKAPVQTVTLRPERRLDLAVIGAASLYAPLVVLRGHLAWQDAIVLLGLYVLYMRRANSGEPEPPHLVGISAELGRMPAARRKRWVSGLMAFAAVTVLLTAEPFAHAVMMSGQSAGISPYLLVQWLVPLATETPELVIAFVLVLHERAGQAVSVLLASAVSQWTFALGTLPVAYALGAGQGPLELLARERVEVLLTTGQGLLAVAVLMTLRLGRRDAVLMLALFVAQLAIPMVAVRAMLTVAYLTLAADILASERRAIPLLTAALHGRDPAPRRASGRSRPDR